jgi:membrane protease YdiL (CAAX protease family)
MLEQDSPFDDFVLTPQEVQQALVPLDSRPLALPAPGPPRVWPVFVACGAVLPVMFVIWILAFTCLFIFNSVSGNFSAEGSRAQVQDAMKNPAFLIPILAAISLANLGIAVWGGWLSPLKPRRRLALEPGSAGWGAMILLAIGTLAFGMAALCFIQLIGIHAHQGANQLLKDMARNASPGQYAALLTVVSLFPAVCEEMLFRGYAQTRLIARWGSVWGIGISAVMFGIVHMDPVQTPDMILLGSYLGWVAYRTGSTRTSIVCHLINNLTAISLAVIGSKSASDDAAASTAPLLILLVLALIVCGICTWFANRLIPPRAGTDS